MIDEKHRMALLAYIIKRYNEEDTCSPLGRTIFQKLCYFMRFANVPIPYKFELYHYGPYSQQLRTDIEFMKVDGYILDQTEGKNCSRYGVTPAGESLSEDCLLEIEGIKTDVIDAIIHMFSRLSAEDMELFSTTHYSFWALKNYHGDSPDQEAVIAMVKRIKKDKFNDPQIIHAFGQIKKVGLLD